MDHEVSFRITLVKPPADVDFGLQKGHGSKYETVQKQRSKGNDLSFEFKAGLKAGRASHPDFSGPYVQGPPNERFVYIDIGACAGQTDTIWSRRLKIPFRGITKEMTAQIMNDPKMELATKVPGTAKDGGPNCATVKSFEGWKLKK